MGHTILLADDSITIQKVIELTFSDEDFKLHTVGNGQKAMDDVRTVRPDIVLCDIIMPEKNGYEVCEFIKTHPELKHIPVLLLTGAFEPFDQERARQAGCDGFLAKPFEPQTLISKVRELLASAKRPVAQPAAAPTPPAPRPGAPPPPRPAAPPPTPHAAAPPQQAPQPPPRMATPAPPAAPPPRAAPPAPPAPPLSADSTVVKGFTPPPPPSRVEDFAYEVGARELSVDSGDRNMFLDDTPAAASEDIWSEVQSGAGASLSGIPEEITGEVLDDGSTVMMSAPPPIEAPRPASPTFAAGTGFDDLVVGQPVGPESALPPAEPELTPVEGFGSFDAFATTEQASLNESAEDGGTVMFSTPPSVAPPPPPPSAWETAWENPDASASTWGEEDVPTVQSIGSSVPRKETPLWGTGTAPTSPVPRSPETTWEDNVRPEARSGVWDDDSGSVPVQADWQEEDEAPVDTTWQEPDVAVEEPAPLTGGMAKPSPTPVAAAPPAPRVDGKSAGPVVPGPAAPGQIGLPAPVGQGGQVGQAGKMDEVLQREIQRIVSQISEKVIQEIAWEVIPDLAEAMIRKEIEAIKAKIPQ